MFPEIIVRGGVEACEVIIPIGPYPTKTRHWRPVTGVCVSGVTRELRAGPTEEITQTSLLSPFLNGFPCFERRPAIIFVPGAASA